MNLGSWTLVILAVKPKQARLHRCLQRLLNAGGQVEYSVIQDLKRRSRQLRIGESVRAAAKRSQAA